MLSEKDAAAEEPAGDPAPEEEAPTAEQGDNSELLETIPAEEQPATGQLLEACPACGTLMDVTEQAPFAKIYCPSCGQNLRARRQFNNYQIIDQLGEGGMGAVFKALDCNLRRNVALKILKKECSANAEERAKLEQEARITASINHPHVVKVFSFGEDHGQFYLAMELVEKGSLDQLMSLQNRVAEAQVLSVAIQIAEGLEAALERGLIHRDIKPGNILFSDPHTAKLVDFGLAVVMDEAAQERGEIWGTPYYIAPEKLDNQPEDFRSDIYSLGGTLFHALAGRPPYEAESASMVALKQLKSQSVSLQAFAPDVSSETAYVVNRMLAKDPADRYSSYRELIDHLSYARNKLAERVEKPRKKERVVLETQQTRNFTAYLSLGLLATLILVGVLIYAFRDKIFPEAAAAAARPATLTSYSPAEAMGQLSTGVDLMANRQFDEARGEFQRVAELPGMVQPAITWARLSEGLASLCGGDGDQAAETFDKIVKAGPYADESEQAQMANFFVEVAKNMANPTKVIPKEIANIYSKTNYEGFSLLAYALHDWSLGEFAEAGGLLKTFRDCTFSGPDKWLDGYKPLATFYLDSYNTLIPLESALAKVTNAQEAQALLPRVRQAAENAVSGGKMTERLQAIEQELIAKGAKP